METLNSIPSWLSLALLSVVTYFLKILHEDNRTLQRRVEALEKNIVKLETKLEGRK
jgi:cell division protein FtsB